MGIGRASIRWRRFYTQEKLRLLEKTRDKLGKAAPWTIALGIFIGLRCLAQAISLLCAGYVVATPGWIHPRRTVG